jgi:hypothetical protein
LTRYNLGDTSAFGIECHDGVVAIAIFFDRPYG